MKKDFYPCDFACCLFPRATAYAKEPHGSTKYIFVDGMLFGFGSHMYRHYCGVKLTEMG